MCWEVPSRAGGRVLSQTAMPMKAGAPRVHAVPTRGWELGLCSRKGRQPAGTPGRAQGHQCQGAAPRWDLECGWKEPRDQGPGEPHSVWGIASGWGQQGFCTRSFRPRQQKQPTPQLWLHPGLLRRVTTRSCPPAVPWPRVLSHAPSTGRYPPRYALLPTVDWLGQIYLRCHSQ